MPTTDRYRVGVALTEIPDARPRWQVNLWQVAMIVSALIASVAAAVVTRMILWGMQLPALAAWAYGLVGLVGMGAFVVGVVFGIRDARVWTRRDGAVDVLVWAGVGVLLGALTYLPLAFFGDAA